MIFDVLIFRRSDQFKKNTFDVLINQSTFRLSMFFFWLSMKWFSTFWPFPLNLIIFQKIRWRWRWRQTLLIKDDLSVVWSIKMMIFKCICLKNCYHRSWMRNEPSFLWANFRWRPKTWARIDRKSNCRNRPKKKRDKFVFEMDSPETRLVDHSIVQNWRKANEKSKPNLN